jgi:hypothetical protein
VIRTIDGAGLRLVEEVDFSELIIPDLKRIEAISKRAFKHKTILSLLLKIFPKEFSYNAITGYFMADAARLGYSNYTMSVFQKTS